MNAQQSLGQSALPQIESVYKFEILTVRKLLQIIKIKKKNFRNWHMAKKLMIQLIQLNYAPRYLIIDMTPYNDPKK